MNPTTLKSWLQRGDLEKLEHAVLEGRGARLLGEHSQDLRTRVFLKGLPNYLTKISHVHEAVSHGSLAETQKLISEEPKKKLAIAKDSAGTPLLHKAVYYDQQDIVEWLVQNYPITVQQKDREGRTALHYCAACKDSDAIWDVLIENDCDASICDKKGNPAAYYLEHTSELELPEAESMSRRKTSSGKESLDFKPSNIRIWIHNRDIGKLQQVLWEGHGNKLRMETSNNPRVKKFLEAVSFIMGTIKEIHTSTINNDLDGLRSKIDATSPIVLCGKDSNGLNVLHKAAGLGFTEIVREILEKQSSVVEAQDNDGKTPLHYAAAAKDDGVLYNLLTEYGADESKLDHRQKAPAFYKNRPSDIDQSLLTVIPEAPRVAGTAYPKHWDWRILEAEESISRGMKKVSSADIDSAFGSAESTSKNFSRSMEQIKNIEEDHHKDQEGNSGDAENADKPEEKENTEDAKNTENADENTENAEPVENVENTENTENTEHAESTENAEDTKEPESIKNKEEETTQEAELEETEERTSDDDVVTGTEAQEMEENTKSERNDEEEKAEETEGENKLEEQEETGKEAHEKEKEEEENKKEDEHTKETTKANDVTEHEEENKVDQEERNEPSTGDSGVDDPGNDEDQVQSS